MERAEKADKALKGKTTSHGSKNTIMLLNEIRPGTKYDLVEDGTDVNGPNKTFTMKVLYF